MVAFSAPAMEDSKPFFFCATASSTSASLQKTKRVSKSPRNRTMMVKNMGNQSSESTHFFSAKPTIKEPTFSTTEAATNFEGAPLSSSSPFETKRGDGKFLISSLPIIRVARVLNGIPQSPHFYQLRNVSALTRKSLISGWDQVFEETVKQLNSLQMVNFWPKAKELWKTMEDLQSMGYNVVLLRRRVVELTDVMTELFLAQMEITWLRIKAENHRIEQSRLESLVLNLQETVRREQEIMQSALTEAAKKENELQRVEAEFNKITTKPLLA